MHTYLGVHVYVVDAIIAHVGKSEELPLLGLPYIHGRYEIHAITHIHCIYMY